MKLPSMLKKVKYYIEAAALSLLFTAFRLLPLDTASFLGGWMARNIGCLLPANKTAYKNISLVFPNLPKQEKQKLIAKMWDNIGRTAAELAHLHTEKLVSRINIIGAENFPKHDIPAFLFSGHLGNWELLMSMAQKYNRPITGIYRAANNKLVDNMINKIRLTRCLDLIPKGKQGAIKIARSIKNNAAIAMLVDQKMNDGIAVPFLGYPAMTAPAIAELALRYDMPIIPARIIRKKGAYFEGIVYTPIKYIKTGNTEQDVYNIMLTINQLLEDWIKEYPEQWFWVHKRWPKN